LGIFRLNGIPSAPKGIPKISVTFQLDVNGLLSVSAREEKSGKEQSIKIEGASVLGREEVSKMIEEAEQNATFDKSKKALVNVTYELDNLLSKYAKIEAFVRSNSFDSELENYFLNSFTQLQYFYNEKNFQKILSSSKELSHSLNLVVVEFLQKELLSQNTKSSEGQDGKQKGNIIDITGE